MKIDERDLTPLERKVLDTVNGVICPRRGMPILYTLDEQGEPVPCYDTLEWGNFMELKTRIIERTTIQTNPEIMVSTVFLGTDHGWRIDEDPDYKPVLWETMVFGLGDDNLMDRYTSLENARKGHEATCWQVKNILTRAHKVTPNAEVS